MGCRYEFGEGVEKDIDKAVHYYKMSDCPRGIFALTKLYDEGLWIPSDEELEEHADEEME